MESNTKGTRRFVVLPAYGYKSNVISRSNKLLAIGAATPLELRSEAGSPQKMRVLHSLHENGPKLVEMTAEAELSLRVEVAGLKIVPVIHYSTARREPETVEKTAGPELAAGPARGVVIKVADGSTDRPVADANVVAFTNFRHRVGAGGKTGRDGSVRLDLAPNTRLDRLYVFGPKGYWGFLRRPVVLEATLEIALIPIDLTETSYLLPQTYGHLPMDAGRGVTIGVVDTGIDGAHADLTNTTGGANLVFDEIADDSAAQNDWGPARTDGEHGTHVGGIVGANGAPPNGLRGVAPGVNLRSYRVFPHAGGGASNYDIMNAIDRAAADGCEIINLSLGGAAADEAVRAAIGNALQNGSLVIAAAGNDGRKPVSYPAAWSGSVAISAMGRKSALPPDVSDRGDISPPFGDPETDYFIAAFSNIGPQIDLIGPGVGVVSTVPGGHAVMSGTSMAAPAVAGFAAYLLSSNPDIMQLTGESRSRELRHRLYASAVPLGFGRDFEGFGLPGAK